MTSKNRRGVLIHPHSGCVTISGLTPSHGITVDDLTGQRVVQKQLGVFVDGLYGQRFVHTLESIHKQFDSFYAFEKATGVHTNTQKQWLKNHALVDSEGYVYIRNRGGVKLPL